MLINYEHNISPIRPLEGASDRSTAGTTLKPGIMSEGQTHLGKTCFSPHASLYFTSGLKDVYCVGKWFFIVNLQHRKVEYPAMGNRLLLCYPVEILWVGGVIHCAEFTPLKNFVFSLCYIFST